MNVIKKTGAIILGIAGLFALAFLGFSLITGVAFVATKILPFLVRAGSVTILICVFILLPLSLFRSSRSIASLGFYIASYIFGLYVWMYGFLVTYELWGGTGLFVGLFLGLVGVVPLGIIASAFHGIWYYVGELTFGLVLTYATRAFALFLARTLEREPYRPPTGTVADAQTALKRRPLAIAWRLIWKSAAVVFAIIVGILAANTAGWNGGAAFLAPSPYSEGARALFNLTIGVVAFFGCIAIGYFIFRVAKWSLLAFVPLALYSGLVVGTWNGVASGFDATRLEVIRYRYANAYALQHMSAPAADVTCHDATITLTDDAKAFCAALKK